MSLSATGRVAYATWRAAWAEAWSNQVGFWLQVAIMVVNDAAWIVFWWLFFRRVGAFGGWDLDLLILLYAVFMTSGGIVLGLFNNARRIGELAANGGLDAILALPTQPLLAVLTRRVDTIFVGDLGFGVVLFLILGHPTPQRAAVFIFGVLTSVMVLGGFLVFVGSLNFWIGRSEASELGFHAILLFANYPVGVFGRPIRLVMHLVVPAAFVSSVPAGLIADFGWLTALRSLAVAVVVAGLAAATFNRGLARYTSGARWSTA